MLSDIVREFQEAAPMDGGRTTFSSGRYWATYSVDGRSEPIAVSAADGRWGKQRYMQDRIGMFAHFGVKSLARSGFVCSVLATANHLQAELSVSFAFSLDFYMYIFVFL